MIIYNDDKPSSDEHNTNNNNDVDDDSPNKKSTTTITTAPLSSSPKYSQTSPQDKINDDSNNIFDHIDTPLRHLLTSLEQQQHQQQSSHVSLDVTISQMRYQTTQFNTLSTFLLQTSEEDTLVIMADYFLLPSLLIMKRPHHPFITPPKTPVYQSLMKNRLSDAIRLLQSFLKATSIKLTESLGQKCLTALGVSLSLILGDDDDDPKDKTSSLQPPTLSLDDSCDECLSLHLSTMSILLPRCPSSLISTLEDDEEALLGAVFVRCGCRSLRLMEGWVMLEEMMRVLTSGKFWRRVFPGCFSAMYQSLMYQLTTISHLSTTKNRERSLRATSRLLSLVLSSSSSHSSSSKLSPDLQLRHELFTVLAPHLPSTTTPPPKKTHDDLFFHEIRSRLPLLLIPLLNILFHSSLKGGLELCRVLLIDGFRVWHGCEGEGEEVRRMVRELERMVWECCLSYGVDDEQGGGVPTLSPQSQSIISSYRTLHPSWNQFLSTTIHPRLIQLIDECPPLALSGRMDDFDGSLRILRGYLILLLDEEGWDVRQEEVIKVVTRSFSLLFTLHPTPASNTPLLLPSPTSSSQSILPPSPPPTLTFRYNTSSPNNNNNNLLLPTIRLLGHVMTERSVCRIVDSCVADVMDALREMRGEMEEGVGRWGGLLVLAKELLVGCYDINNDNKQRKLPSILYSILHLLCDPMLTIHRPTTMEAANAMHDKQDTANDEVELCHALFNSSSLNEKALLSSSHRRRHHPPPSVLHANTQLLTVTIDLISTITTIIILHSPSSDETVNIVLPLLLTLQSKSQSVEINPIVRWSAECALHRMAAATSTTNNSDSEMALNQLIHYHFDTLSDNLIATLRRRRTLHFRKSQAISVIEAVLRLSFVETLSKVTTSNKCHVRDVNNVVLDYFDNLVQSQERRGWDDVLRVFHVMIVCMKQWVVNPNLSLTEKATEEANHDDVYKLTEEATEEATYDDVYKTEPWLQSLLCDYGRQSQRDVVTDDDDEILSSTMTPHEGFTKYHSLQSQESNNAPTNTTNGNDRHPSTTSSNDISTINDILFRCSYILSIPDNDPLRIAACHVMTEVYDYLSTVGRCQKAASEDNNNPLLPSIADTWPSLLSRLGDLTKFVVSQKQQSSLVRHMAKTIPSASPSRTNVLINLLNLTAVLCELEFDFMMTRIVDDAWPICFVPLLRYFVDSCSVDNDRWGKRRHERGEMTRGNGVATQKNASSFHHPPSPVNNPLLLSLLRCLTRLYTSLYNQRQKTPSSCCSVAYDSLISFVPTIATMIYPFLASENELGDVTFNFLKELMKCDGDALWRGLRVLARVKGNEKTRRQPSGMLVVEMVEDKMGLVARRAQWLLEFREELDELPVYF